MEPNCLARKFDGLDWEEVKNFIKSYQFSTGSYRLRDGSSVKRVTEEIDGKDTVIAAFYSSGTRIK